MKTWSAIFNLFAVFFIAILLVVVNKMDATNRRQFEEVRLSLAIDYATEGAFRASISTDTVGTDYIESGLEEVRVNPSMVLNTFNNILCLSYDLAPSETNFMKIEQSIATGVLCAIDGYYVLETYPDDLDPYDAVMGGQEFFTWGLKRPYLINTEDGRLFAVNLVNESSIEYNSNRQDQDPNDEENIKEPGVIYRTTYDEVAEDVRGDCKNPTQLTDTLKRATIGRNITEDMNIAINNRNLNRTNLQHGRFYMPSGSSLTAINEIKSPTLIILFQNSEFLNGYNMSVTSVGGNRVKVKTHVIGFTIAGDPTKYYCYAGQQFGTYIDADGNEVRKPSITIEKRFNSMHEAALEGYSPHMIFLQDRVPDKTIKQ